ncbi:M61 family metallopeptidase [Cognaticolwellia mytili]|uniref:M61 family metallopeptidase n=1 Tax=Cognaticolwellia mytili TaxID=1888913 RepID=UPI000A1765B9|nr:PDZ domain-containing protein [Cognaticolwellia mytili]
MTLKYTVNFDDVNKHLFNVKIEIPKHPQAILNLSLPAWIPGSYMIRDFSKNIINLKAKKGNEPLNIEPIDKQNWSIASNGEECIVEYQVYAFDSSVRTAYLDQNRAFFNGTSLFLSVNEFKNEKHEVNLVKPSFTEVWKVATGLQRTNKTSLFSFGIYESDNYAELIDCPVEIGNFTHLEFMVAGTPHYIILNGKHYADTERLVQDTIKLCQHHIDLFGKNTAGKPPFDEYWFLTNILPSGFGGLEHKNSTALLCSTFDFPNINKPEELSDGYKTLLSLISHEYFHSWNVCRIKPEEFIPYTLNNESYTKQLWAYEGITSYYDDFSLFRTGIISFEEYLKLKSKTISRVNRGNGQLKQNLIESSYYTWTKFYQQGADAANNIVSYYTKGSLVALWLDLTIRKLTNTTKSLDDVMRVLWGDFLNNGNDYKGTQLDTIISIVNELTETDLTQEFNNLLNGKSPAPLTSLLAEFGVKLEQVPSKTASLLEVSTDCHNPFIGIIFKEAKLGVEATQILENSPAEQAGISVQDNIIAIDNIVVNKANFSDVICNLALSKNYDIAYIRNGELLSSTIETILPINELSQLTIFDNAKVKNWQNQT